MSAWRFWHEFRKMGFKVNLWIASGSAPPPTHTHTPKKNSGCIYAMLHQTDCFLIYTIFCYLSISITSGIPGALFQDTLGDKNNRMQDQWSIISVQSTVTEHGTENAFGQHPHLPSPNQESHLNSQTPPQFQTWEQTECSWSYLLSCKLSS